MIRNGLKDIWWNHKMVENVIFTNNDIPICHTNCYEIPKELITYEEAKKIYYKNKRSNKLDFVYDAFVCFYMDDYKFDSSRGIWFRPEKAVDILKHFKGIITPDFSTYIDFPEPLKKWNIYRDRAFGAYYGSLERGKYQVIPNVRGDITCLNYCFDGLDKNSIICIGITGSGLRCIDNRGRFDEWFYKMCEVLNPHTILVYGSANYECFKNAENMGINIIAYPSSTAKYFSTRCQNE